MFLDITVPDGVGEGEQLEFEHEGTLFNATVPARLSAGATFQIEVGSQLEQLQGSLHTAAPRAAAKPVVELNDYLQARAATGDLMDRFVLWFETHDVEEQFDAFVAQHAHLVQGSTVDSEQSHAWWPVYLEYQNIFEALLQQFLDQEGISAEEFVSAAQAASGMNDIILQIFLSSSDYDTFINLLVDRVNETTVFS